MAKSYLLTATMPDGYVKTIGPTAIPFTHYWRLVAYLDGGGTEVFWGHTKSLAEAKKKQRAASEPGARRGWTRYEFEIAELVRSAGQGQISASADSRPISAGGIASSSSAPSARSGGASGPSR